MRRERKMEVDGKFKRNIWKESYETCNKRARYFIQFYIYFQVAYMQTVTYYICIESPSSIFPCLPGIRSVLVFIKADGKCY